MSETTETPSMAEESSDPAGSEIAAALEETQLSIRTLLEAGVHFGHQTRRWNPKMKHYIFGERNGTHIIDLDQTLVLFREALDHVSESLSEGGKALFVGTKRQAAPCIESEAKRSGQYYVNNRWLGGMLTNWKTVKKSIDRYKKLLEVAGDEEQRAALSKKELAKVNRQIDKYAKSLIGIKEMSKLPDVVFVIDVAVEEIAVSEARRLGIPVIGIVDSNCNPDGVDFVVPGNDDAIRSLDLYCKLVANACIEGEQIHQENLLIEAKAEPSEEKVEAPSTGRRVVEIKQAPRRGRGEGTGGRGRSTGGWKGKKKDVRADEKTPEKAEGKVEAKIAAKPDEKIEAKAEDKPAAKPDEKIEAKAEDKPAEKAEEKTAAKADDQAAESVEAKAPESVEEKGEAKAEETVEEKKRSEGDDKSVAGPEAGAAGSSDTDQS
jgi:small subunit ribosomal protein S2